MLKSIWNETKYTLGFLATALLLMLAAYWIGRWDQQMTDDMPNDPSNPYILNEHNKNYVLAQDYRGNVLFRLIKWPLASPYSWYIIVEEPDQVQVDVWDDIDIEDTIEQHLEIIDCRNDNDLCEQ